MRLAFLIVSVFLFSSVTFSQVGDDELVELKELIPDIVLDLRYNSTNNFVHQKLYSTDVCLISRAVAQRLGLVQDSLRKLNLGLKIFDGYRPRTIQWLMWEIFPNPIYVADPANGSKHNRGSAVDLTIINLSTGQELNMGTDFDYFGPEAGHDYTGFTPEILNNRIFLKSMMQNVGGLTSYTAEWWHYEYVSANVYPLLDFQMK
ncbi:MAG: M15 family metallopeptidase [Ignavibacteria bacterium]|nr:M15 family metallopeptidase [Ignavibacteria bacterium]